jgi:glycerol-3-phosphate O-acyltransferase
MQKIEIILNEFKQKSHFSEKYYLIAKHFALQYMSVIKKANLIHKKHEDLFLLLLKLASENIENPYDFPCYHKKITDPFDYYKFGNEFLSPLIDIEHSLTKGASHIKEMIKHLHDGHNVILFSNHQIEADPQILSLLLDDSYGEFVPNMIHVAGERVTTDPFAIPFSLGRNLLCIYSKKYLDHPPEKSLDKKEHNRRAMSDLSDLLKEGGHCFWVAPSGGRDRRGSNGEFELSPFDPKSIEMFRLLARKSKSKTHFFPLSLLTYPILPPPESVQKELGEVRKAERHPAFLSFGKEINFDELAPHHVATKHEKRELIAKAVWSLVNSHYQTLLQHKKALS